MHVATICRGANDMFLVMVLMLKLTWKDQTMEHTQWDPLDYHVFIDLCNCKEFFHCHYLQGCSYICMHEPECRHSLFIALHRNRPACYKEAQAVLLGTPRHMHSSKALSTDCSAIVH